MARRLAAAALLILIAAGLLFRLDAVPALSLDEAWIGLMARRLVTRGLYSPHEMNHYTGSLYPWGIAAFFASLGETIGALRLFGAGLNTLAAAGFYLLLKRRVSAEAGLAWLLMVAGSAYFLLKGRLAWECYALQPILVLGAAAGLARGGRGGTALLIASAWLGTQNHFIFLSVPASLCLLLSARAAWAKDQWAKERLPSAAAALAAGVTLALLKYPLTDEVWQAHRLLCASGLIALPAAAAAAARRVPASAWSRLLDARLVGLGSAAFVVWHLFPMLQVLAGPIVFARLFSWPLPWVVRLPFFLWGAFLLGLIAWNTVRAWHDEALPPFGRLLLLWPAAIAAVFIAFRHTSSLRYYSLPTTLSLLALACALPRLARADKGKVYLCAGLFALLTQGLLWSEVFSPKHRPPLKLRVGWRREDSKDFLRKDALFKALEDSKVCVVAHHEKTFTAIPLVFHNLTRPPASCLPGAFYAEQCPECPQAPYYRWSVGEDQQ